MRPSARRNRHPASQGDLVVVKRRLHVVFLALFSMQVFLVFNIINKAISYAQEPKAQIKNYLAKEVRRGSIYDTNGTLLATSLKVNSLYADPKMMLDINDAAVKINKVFPDLKVIDIRKKLSNRHRRFVWLKRNLSPRQAYTINSYGIPGLAFKQEFLELTLMVI